jgi:polyhydroxybutyrate depolymerase
VVLYTVTGGGHTWPGGMQYAPPFLIGRTSRDFSASEAVWKFFSACKIAD